MPLSRGIELIKKMSSEPAGDPKAPITKKQVKLLYQIFRLKQLIDDTVHIIVEEVNS